MMWPPRGVNPENDNARLQPGAIEQQATGNIGDCVAPERNGQYLPELRARLTPRHRRVLQALLSAPQTREALDRIAGASNAPDEILRLRRGYGLEIPCTRRSSIDRDGRATLPGTYYLLEHDQVIAAALVANVEGGAQ